MFSEEIMPYLENYFKTLDNKKVRTIVEYSVKGGKCIRGFIVKHILQNLGKSGEPIPWQPIVAVELIHAASLVIDDLPCMDNDNQRRGKPSAFVKFGKHEAILFSLYIIAESLKLLSISLEHHPHKKLNLIIEQWSQLLGKNLVIGQLMDLKCDVGEYFNMDKNNDFNENIIKYKTCSLFSFTFLIAAIFTYKDFKSDLIMKDFKQMGFSFGMMFQLVDDYKDIHEDEPFRNYILSHGKQKSLIKYNQERQQFIQLLLKYKLLTPEFKKMINLLDSRFIPSEKTNVLTS
jgi:geranylgeranyl diphosphate synthase type II